MKSKDLDKKIKGVGEVCVDGRKEKEVCPAEKECYLLNSHNPFNLFIMKKLDFCANGKQKVTTNMKAAQGVQAQNNVGAEQPARFSPNLVDFSQKQPSLFDGTDYRPIEVTNPITNNSNTMRKKTNCAQSAGEAAMTSEASQSVQAQQSSETEQSAQLNQSEEGILYKYLCPTGECESRPVGITHCFDSDSKEYLGSFESRLLYEEYSIANSEDDGYVFENTVWVRTDVAHIDFWFDVYHRDTTRPDLLDSFGEIQKGYFSGDSEVVLKGIHVPVKYSTIDFATFRNAVFETTYYGSFKSKELVEFFVSKRQ